MKRLFRLTPALALCSLFALTETGCAHDHDAPEISADQFMKKVQSEPGVKTLPDGLAYKVLKSGPKDGDSPHRGSTVMVIYEGRLPDGGIFDSSDQHGNGTYMEMPLDGLVEGWLEALPMMHVGDEWMLYLPPKLAYGNRSMGIIPPNSPLIFKIRLLGVNNGPTAN
ncbi:FKBP-type peptidyl-prolyl cis-trans isomerase [Swingsia samuiensis]|uniref:Peptidyl-prolyl cis-trans isomerase n=1 Tax=Swingsia samuiensis TaxID=1293412 RepID=A0A4Y6UFN3_9PROT|nr:FKBP-type peptidyl-prolyl cis-trans isomerase [Swingsia samuiensis]QDH16372.1 FKBP-type peptidyl-prolyl cis-trans isomerase [Swingsia samuiensis]